MMTKAVRWVYLRRPFFKRFIPIRRPVLLNLPDFKLYVRLDDWAVGARIAVKRGYEPHVTAVLRPLIEPGMVLVDIGANIGYYSLLAAARVGPGGKVIAFEPSAQNCELLRMSLAANGFANVVLHPYAVADADKVVGFDMGDSNGRIDPVNPSASAFQVRAVRLDDFLRDEARIDLIKLDIEGAEGLALAGMRSLLHQHHPVIVTEFSPAALKARSGIAPEQYLAFLSDLGYAVFVIDRKQGRSARPQSQAEIMAQFAASASDHLDLLALPAA